MYSGKVEVETKGISRFHLTIGGLTGYSLSLPGSEFKMKSSEYEKNEKYETTHYFYRYDGTEILISDSGDIKIDIKNADLSSLDPSQFSDVRIKADSTVSDTSANLACHERSCSLNDNRNDRDFENKNGGGNR